MMEACQKGFNPVYHEDEPVGEAIKELEGYAILEFGAPWCQHCQAALPIAQEVLPQFELPHIKVFDGKGKPLGRSFNVKLWPTFILLKSGQEVARSVRPVDVQEVKKFLKEVRK